MLYAPTIHLGYEVRSSRELRINLGHPEPLTCTEMSTRAFSSYRPHQKNGHHGRDSTRVHGLKRFVNQTCDTNTGFICFYIPDAIVSRTPRNSKFSERALSNQHGQRCNRVTIT